MVKAFNLFLKIGLVLLTVFLIHKFTTNKIESMEVAKKVLLENFRLPSMHKAMYYHADYVNPNWNLPKISQIGRHIFYGEKNGKI